MSNLSDSFTMLFMTSTISEDVQSLRNFESYFYIEVIR